jgi:hypothetical protein
MKIFKDKNTVFNAINIAFAFIFVGLELPVATSVKVYAGVFAPIFVGLEPNLSLAKPIKNASSSIRMTMKAVFIETLAIVMQMNAIFMVMNG